MSRSTSHQVLSETITGAAGGAGGGGGGRPGAAHPASVAIEATIRMRKRRLLACRAETDVIGGSPAVNVRTEPLQRHPWHANKAISRAASPRQSRTDASGRKSHGAKMFL